MKNYLYYFQGVLQTFIALGAVIYGLMLIIYPTGEQIGIPLELLAESPFDNYVIPGILLFLFNGVGNITGLILSFKKNIYAGLAGILLGIILIGWIIIQIKLIGYANWLQPFYLLLGILEFYLGSRIYIKSKESA